MSETTIPRLIPLTHWPKQHAWPTIGGLRHLVYYSHKNGFDRVIRRVGKRILIDEAAFFQWVNDLQSKAQASPRYR